MPISKKERERLAKHTFSEDRKGEFGSMYDIAPEIGVSAVLGAGVKSFSAGAANALLNVPEGVALAFYLYLLFNSRSVILGIEYTIAFLAFQFFVSSILDARASVGFAKGKMAGALDAIGISFGHLRPLAYVIAMLTLFAILNRGLLGLQGVPFYMIVAIGAVISLLWHIVNIDSAMAPYVRYLDTGASRSVAINRSWHYMSNQSVKLLAANITVFLPVVALTLAYALTLNVYVLSADFLGFVICASLWQATTSAIYAYVKRNLGKFDYSKV